MSASLKDTETQQWLSPPSVVSDDCLFFQSCLFLQKPRKGATVRNVFLYNVLLFLSDEQYKWDSWDESPKGLQRKLCERDVESVSEHDDQMWSSRASEYIKRVMHVFSQGWSGEFLKVPACQKSSGMSGVLEDRPIKWAVTQMVRSSVYIKLDNSGQSKALYVGINTEFRLQTSSVKCRHVNQTYENGLMNHFMLTRDA